MGLGIRDAVAETIAGARTPGQIVLAPGKKVAGNRAAIALVLLVQEHAVVERIMDCLEAGLDMAPRLLDAPPRNEIRHDVLRGIEERRIAEAGIGDVGRHRRSADRCRASRRPTGCRRGSPKATSRPTCFRRRATAIRSTGVTTTAS